MITFLPAAFLLAQGPKDDRPTVVLEAQGSNIGVPLAPPDLYDGLMVATVLTPALGHPVSDESLLAAQRVRVRVEDSRAFAPGTVMNVYFETTGSSMSANPVAGIPLEPGRRHARGGEGAPRREGSAKRRPAPSLTRKLECA